MVFDIDISYHIVLSEKISNFSIFKNIAIHHNIFDNIAISSIDCSLHCVTGKTDYKQGGLKVI